MQAAADDVAGKHGKDGSGRDGGVLAGEGGGSFPTVDAAPNVREVSRQFWALLGLLVKGREQG